VHGLGVAHLADLDHVRVLPHRSAHRHPEVGGVDAHLALVDQRPLVVVDDLDGILDGHHVHVAVLVDLIDHARQGGGLARAGRAGHQDQAAGLQ
jgi:hypothetical protein